MIEGKFEDLLNREIDGETTDRETSELEEYLAMNPRAKAYQEDLESLAAMFERVRDLDPPQDLKEEILRAARLQAAAAAAPDMAASGSETGWTSILAALRQRLQLRSPYAFATGIAVGALMFALFAGSFTSTFRVDESVSPGALVPSEALAVYTQIDAQAFQLDGVSGQATTRIHQDRLLIELQLESRQAVQVWVAPEAGEMIPVAFRQNDPRGGRVAIGETEVAITHEGTNTYYVVLRSDGVAGGALFIRARSGTEESEFSLQTQ